VYLKLCNNIFEMIFNTFKIQIFKTFKKYSFFLGLAYLTITEVFAQDTTISNPLGDLKTLTDIVNRFTSFLIPTSVVGFMFCVIYATYIRLFSGGESAKEKLSMKVARNAAIGFFVIFVAGVALQVLGSVLKVNV